MAGLRARAPYLVINEWQRSVLNHLMGEEVAAEVLRALNAAAPLYAEHCDCSAIPWPDHWHRRKL